MITDRRKFPTKITLYWISSFHLHHWNQFKLILLTCTLRTRKALSHPQILIDVGRLFTTRHDGLSGRGVA